MPSPPYRYHIPDAKHEFELSALGRDVAKAEERRQKAFETSRKMQIALAKAKQELESGPDPEAELSTEKSSGDSNVIAPSALSILDSLMKDSIPEIADRKPRENSIMMRVEDYVRFNAFKHFLETGRLLAPSACSYATDEEYLAGACMGLCDDLARYGRGRATARDGKSVKMASNIVSEILEYLLEFNFRNGPLRRKYDGTKYSLRTLETLLYELSVTGMDLEKHSTGLEDISDSLLPKDELTAIRERMEHRDDLRENLIKRCRDGQKAAKQSIYALHRGDMKRSRHLLDQSQSVIKELIPVIEQEPNLRYGSFANVVEEFVEARLFYVWLDNEDKDEDETKMKTDDDQPKTASKTTNSIPSGIILKSNDFEVDLEPGEYLGGLCDLTGEVGRYAVQRATSQDTNGVKICLQTNMSILTEIQTMERLPHGVGKKMDALRRSVEKLERILYEMSLTEATGGRNVEHDNTMDTDPGDNDKNTTDDE